MAVKISRDQLADFFCYIIQLNRSLLNSISFRRLLHIQHIMLHLLMRIAHM